MHVLPPSRGQREGCEKWTIFFCVTKQKKSNLPYRALQNIQRERRREIMIVASFQQEYIDVFFLVWEKEREGWWELVPETRSTHWKTSRKKNLVLQLHIHRQSNIKYFCLKNLTPTDGLYAFKKKNVREKIFFFWSVQKTKKENVFQLQTIFFSFKKLFGKQGCCLFVFFFVS